MAVMGLPIWVLGGDGSVLWMSCFGFVLRLCGFGDGGGCGGGGSFGFGFRLWGWKNGFGVGGLWCFGGGSGWSVVTEVGVLMLVNLEC
uniref:Transmembrane protein n=1 Tax=Fagus sylvatica TaxID=28930 RepID=A0A2N9F630_FAGSY